MKLSPVISEDNVTQVLVILYSYSPYSEAKATVSIESIPCQGVIVASFCQRSKFSTVHVTAKHVLSNNLTVLDLRRKESVGSPHFRTNTLSAVCSVIQVLGGFEVTSGQRFCHIINLDQIVTTKPDQFFMFNEVKLFIHGETAVSKFKGKGKESVKDATVLVDYFRYFIDFKFPVYDYTPLGHF